MIIMYNTHSGFQPTKHYKVLEKPKSISWKKLNKRNFPGLKHWLCFYLPEAEKTFNVYYPKDAIVGEKIIIVIDPNNIKYEWDDGVYSINWTEGKTGLFEREIKQKLLLWIAEMSNKS